MPPIDVLRIGEICFVRDGHHRVSVAHALGHGDIDAHVTDVVTRVGADRTITLADLPLKTHERVFFERVPLADEARQRIQLSDPWDYGTLAESIEAWGFRASQDHHEGLNRAATARLWFETEYEPVVAMLREAHMLGEDTETEAYMRVVAERYRLLRTNRWDEEVLQRIMASKRRWR